MPTSKYRSQLYVLTVILILLIRAHSLSHTQTTSIYVRREAVRQRKALSRTSSNILLNSVQMGHNVHNLNQYHHINNYNNHPSDCELTSKLKDLKEEDSQLSMSNIEVKCFVVLLLLLGLCNVRCISECNADQNGRYTSVPLLLYK